jgi:hypothetical protein
MPSNQEVEAALLGKINWRRGESGLPPYFKHERFSGAAYLHSISIADWYNFQCNPQHAPPPFLDGCCELIAVATGVDACSVADNLIRSLESEPGHRTQLFNGYTHAGIGVTQNPRNGAFIATVRLKRI